MLIVCANGCEESSEVSSTAGQRLQALSTVYLDYAVAKGTGPANLKQLEAHLQNAPPFDLSAKGLANDGGNLFISSRDNEPFLISYGMGLEFKDDARVIACERIGKDGKRLAAFANGKIDLVDEDIVKELLP
jgi:hypothetical protein